MALLCRDLSTFRTKVEAYHSTQALFQCTQESLLQNSAPCTPQQCEPTLTSKPTQHATAQHSSELQDPRIKLLRSLMRAKRKLIAQGGEWDELQAACQEAAQADVQMCELAPNLRLREAFYFYNHLATRAGFVSEKRAMDHTLWPVQSETTPACIQTRRHIVLVHFFSGSRSYEDALCAVRHDKQLTGIGGWNMSYSAWDNLKGLEDIPGLLQTTNRIDLAHLTSERLKMGVMADAVFAVDALKAFQASPAAPETLSALWSQFCSGHRIVMAFHFPCEAWSRSNTGQSGAAKEAARNVQRSMLEHLSAHHTLFEYTQIHMYPGHSCPPTVSSSRGVPAADDESLTLL